MVGWDAAITLLVNSAFGAAVRNKKTYAVERPDAVDYVGLLVNEPPVNRAALQLVIRQIRSGRIGETFPFTTLTPSS
jgi:hypothetical protein